MTNLELQKVANEVRKDIITEVHSAKSGHPGGSLSAADVFTYLYFEEMNIDRRIRRSRTAIASCSPRDTRLRACMRRLQSVDSSRRRICRHCAISDRICRVIPVCSTRRDLICPVVLWARAFLQP